MRNFSSYFIVCVLCFSADMACAGVYKWVDENGKVHFSDRVPGGAQAEQVKIRTYSGPAEVSNDSSQTNSRGIRLFTTSWCGVCKKAKTYLQQKGIAFTEYDVEKSVFGKSEYKRLRGTGVPIILVGKKRMNGFSPVRLDQLLRTQQGK